MATEQSIGDPIVWHPAPDIVQHANLTRFIQSNDLDSFNELLKRSVDDPAWFTERLLEFLDIEFFTPYEQILDLSRGIQWPKWCVGGVMNIVHNCLDKRMGTPFEDQLAVIWEGEEGECRRFTYRELHHQVNQVANALRSLGIEKGDVVGLFMPMVPEIVSAFLGVAKLGGIVLPLFSGYGAHAIATRLVDSGAKLMFTSDGFYRRGKPIEMKKVADEAAAAAPDLEHIIIFQRLQLPVDLIKGRDWLWDEIIPVQSTESTPVPTLADDPLMLIYTSGTTGRPKGAIHTHCGFPIKTAQDMAFGTDVHAQDVVYWVTDMGWMMGPWLVLGSLLLGATFLIYDGAPDFPDVDRLWSLVQRHQVSMLGISPTLIRALLSYGEGPVRQHDLSCLKTIASTGEAWNPDPWAWLFKVVGEEKIPIINYSGGTEIGGGILMGNPLMPMKSCALSAECPGMDVDVFDENGNSIQGEVGELVVKTPWIGMTRGFWKDPDRYIQTYWSTWEDIWIHGDYALRDEDGMWYILGRSDDTLKIGGKRIGPAEIENLLVEHQDIIEAAVIGIPHPIKGEEVVAFCVPSTEDYSEQTLGEVLREGIVQALGKPLAPRAILLTGELPKTHNGKVMRRMARIAFLGDPLPDTSTMLNPSCLEVLQDMGKRFRENR
jgi:acetyl-CoA synthetase